MTRALVALASILSGCAGETTSLPAAVDGGSEHPKPPDASNELVFPPCEPTFESIQNNIFAIACGVDACHGLGIPAWGLTLTDGPRARERLVEKPSQSCGEFYLVSPGSPQDSFLWMKVSSEKPPCGEPMPKGGAPLPEWSKVCIRDWIAGLRARADARVDARADD